MISGQLPEPGPFQKLDSELFPLGMKNPYGCAFKGNLTHILTDIKLPADIPAAKIDTDLCQSPISVFVA